MNFIRFAFCPLIALGLLSSILCGAEFRALSWQGSIQNVTYIGQARGEKLQISDGALGTWQKITPGAAAIEFRRVLPPSVPGTNAAAPAGGEAAGSAPAPAELLARVEWPVGVNRALLLFVPAPAGSTTPFGVVVIPEREATAVPPAIRFFNYSAGPIAVQLGQEAPLQMEPRQIHEDEDRPASGAKMLKLAYREGDEWKVAASRNIAVPPGFVTYIFVRNIPPFALEPNNPTVSYKLLYDRLPPTPKPAGN